MAITYVFEKIDKTTITHLFEYIEKTQSLSGPHCDAFAPPQRNRVIAVNALGA